MKYFLQFSLLLTLLTACVPPEHYRGTENISPANLSTISFNDNEVLILEIDGIEYTGATTGRFYLESGAHKIQFKLRWVDTTAAGNTYITTTKDSSIIKTACINTKPETRYYFYARDPGPNWRLLVWEQSAGINEKYSVQLCE